MEPVLCCLVHFLAIPHIFRLTQLNGFEAVGLCSFPMVRQDTLLSTCLLVLGSFLEFHSRVVGISQAALCQNHASSDSLVTSC